MVSKWFFIPVEYIDSKITIWSPDDISLIYLCWATYMYTVIHVTDVGTWSLSVIWLIQLKWLVKG